MQNNLCLIIILKKFNWFHNSRLCIKFEYYLVQNAGFYIQNWPYITLNMELMLETLTQWIKIEKLTKWVSPCKFQE